MQLNLCFCDNSAMQYPFLDRELKFIQVEALNKVDCCQLHTNLACLIHLYIYIMKA